MAQPGVLRARQPRVAAGLKLAVLGAAHAIDALVEVLGAVEAIEHDLRLGVGHPRATARRSMPHTASHPSFNWRATAVTAASRNQSIANRSNSSVNFEPGVAHGTALCTTPWVGHSTRGTRAWSRVWSWHVSRCRH